jgi:hypothetical protein
MPNPFPGMNPYLEDPVHWPAFHGRLISAIENALILSFPYGFVAGRSERVYQDGWNLIPPVSGESTMPHLSAAQRLGYDPPIRLSLTPRIVREAFVEVRRANDTNPIAIIEVLSPANKTPESGREEYQRQQKEVKKSSAHLIEIDLLRCGVHTIAPDGRATRTLIGQCDYLVSLHRAGEREIYYLWPGTVRERLPRILIPLVEGIEPFLLDLQAVINRVYEDGEMEKSIRYPGEPNPPLVGEDAEWANALLREKGLR